MRNLRRAQASYQKNQIRARIADIESQIGFRTLEDPRERAQLNQSMFGRGLGKSTIATQNQARLADIQARRIAVLQRQKALGEQGLSLIRKQARAQRRFSYIDTTQAIAGTAASFGLSAAMSSGKSAPQNADSSNWTPVDEGSDATTLYG